MIITQDEPLRAKYYRDGDLFRFEYFDVQTFNDLPINLVQQVYGVCFFGKKMVIVRNGARGTWGLVGGRREQGESIDQTLRSEIKEESNMHVLKWRPIGAQKVIEPDNNFYYQLRVVCKVNPLGPFISDPGGNVCEVKSIDPVTYKEYVDWQEIGEHIIRRALQIQSNL